MALHENAENRLYNWKFSQALTAAKNQDRLPTTDEILKLKALADTFGNCGWFDGTMATIIQMAVHDLIGDHDL